MMKIIMTMMIWFGDGILIGQFQVMVILVLDDVTVSRQLSLTEALLTVVVKQVYCGPIAEESFWFITSSNTVAIAKDGRLIARFLINKDLTEAVNDGNISGNEQLDLYRNALMC